MHVSESLSYDLEHVSIARLEDVFGSEATKSEQNFGYFKSTIKQQMLEGGLRMDCQRRC